MKKNIISFSIYFIIFIPSFVLAGNHYVRDGAIGANNGSDWINAWTSLPSSLIRGDTYYIADGTYFGYTFDDAESGTSIITIKKAIESDHGTETGWDLSYGDGVATFTSTITISSGYLVLDGQVGSKVSGHGFKIVMPNAANTKGIYFPSNLTNVTISHLEIDGTAGQLQQSHQGIYVCCSTVDSVTLRYIWIHDTGVVNLVAIGSQDWLVEYSVFQRPNSNGGQHSEIWSCHEGGGTRTPDNWTVRYNIFTDPVSTGGVMTSGTGWKIYGNLFTRTKAHSSFCGNGILGGWSAQPGGNHLVYNNTFVNLGDASNNCGKLFSVAGGSGTIVKNNLFYNMTNFQNNASNKSYNAFGNMAAPGESNQQILSSTGSDVFVSYSSPYWVPATDDLRLKTPTTAGDSTIGAEYNIDLYGKTRGADSVWDRGAYEYTGVVDPPPPPGKTPLPPSNLSVQ